MDNAASQKYLNLHIATSASTAYVARVRWELSHYIQFEDILRFLVTQEISFAKAVESIQMRIAGNEPALPNSKKEEVGEEVEDI